ncbi:MAG: LamG domain-containing protein [Bacillota bacterium]
MAQDFSVSAWIKTSHTGSIQYIVNQGDTNGSFWLRFEADGSLRFLLDYGSTFDAVQSAASFADDRWHHVVGAADRDAGLQLYVDGALVAQSSAMPGGSISSALPLTIGSDSALTLKGLIDEVKLYNYVLDEFEVLGLGGVAGSWSFDEPAVGSGIVTANAVSDYEYGMLLNGAARSSAGKSGEAVQLSGSGQFVKLGNPDSGAYDFGTDRDFSLTAWFKTDVSGTPRYIINKGDTNASYALRIESNDTIRFWLDYGSTADVVQSTRAYADGRWHHVAAVADRDTGLRLYVDGILVGENASLTGGNISNKLSLTVGHNSSSTLNGLIDEVRLYRYALTEEEAVEISQY